MLRRSELKLFAIALEMTIAVRLRNGLSIFMKKPYMQ